MAILFSFRLKFRFGQVWELTSSGMTHSWGAGFAPAAIKWARRAVTAALPLRHTVEIYDGLNFGELTVDSSGEWLRMLALDVHGEPAISQVLPLRAPPPLAEGEASRCEPWQGAQRLDARLLALQLLLATAAIALAGRCSRATAAKRKAK